MSDLKHAWYILANIGADESPNLDEIAEANKYLERVSSPGVYHDNANEPKMEVNVGKLHHMTKNFVKNRPSEVRIPDPEGTPEDDCYNQDPDAQNHDGDKQPNVLKVS